MTQVVVGPVARSFKPVTDHVLIRPDAVPEKIGLIYIPENIQQDRAERPQHATGVVVAVGPGMPVKDDFGDETWPVVDGRRRWPPHEAVKPGAHVYYEQQGGQVIELDDVRYVVVRDPAVALVIDEAP